jgi:hypothetical protein
MKIYKIDFHVANRTEAKTNWVIELNSGKVLSFNEALRLGIIRLVASTLSEKKTHWDRYIAVYHPNQIKYFIRIRVSSRGNVTYNKYTFEDMDKLYLANPEEVKMLKVAKRHG